MEDIKPNQKAKNNRKSSIKNSPKKRVKSQRELNENQDILFKQSKKNQSDNITTLLNFNKNILIDYERIE